MSELTLITPSIDQLSRIISVVAAPAFLLSAVASFISVLITRINRILDRSQALNGITDNDDLRAYLKTDLPRLQHRARLLSKALTCAIIAGILTGNIIIVAFISALFQVQHEYGVALLFVAALVMFCTSLIYLARETRISLHEYDYYN